MYQIHLHIPYVILLYDYILRGPLLCEASMYMLYACEVDVWPARSDTRVNERATKTLGRPQAPTRLPRHSALARRGAVFRGSSSAYTYLIFLRK